MPTITIDEGAMGSDGRIDARVDASQLVKDYVSANGTVDTELIVTDGVEEASWFSSVARVGAGWTPVRRRGQSGAQAPEHVNLDLENRRAVTDSDRGDRAAKGGARVDSVSREAFDRAVSTAEAVTLSVAPASPKRWGGSTSRSLSVAVPTEICQTWSTKTIYNLPEVFAQAYGWRGAKVKMDFDSGTSHTLGVARTSGRSWSASGTATITYGAGATVGGIVDANVLNKVNYRDYEGSCTPYTTRKPLSIAAPMPSGEFTYAPHVNYSASCNKYASGTSTWKTSSTNFVISGGVDVGPINVSAQSGWNKATKMTFEVTAPSWLCGSTTAGWASSPGSSSKPA